MRLEIGKSYKDSQGREYKELVPSGPLFLTDKDRRGFLWYRDTGENFCVGRRPDWDLVAVLEVDHG